jgi:proteic killer suppression protein
MQIRSFGHKGLQRFFQDDDSRLLHPALTRRVRNILSAIEAAKAIEQIATMPGWHLHSLRGDRTGFYSLRVTANWRITFRVVGKDVFDLNLEDYH